MSSPNSPPLNLELRAPRLEAWVAYVAVTVAALAPLAVLPWMTGVVCGVLSAGLIYSGFASTHWLAPAQQIARVSWLADGRWVVEESSGTIMECELRRGSRVFAHAAWLCLEPSKCSHKALHVLLTSFGLHHPSELRRLILRLRLDGVRSPSPTQLSEP
jgi:hypothetical protein